MAIADPAAAVTWLRRYLEHLTMYLACLEAEAENPDFSDVVSADKWKASDALHEGVRGLQAIAAAADADLAKQITYELEESDWRALLDPVRILIGAIDQAAEIEAIVGPQGPRLAAAQLHEWVWVSAAKLWSDGHRRSAVQTAAASVEQQLRAKTNRPSGPAAGLADAFKLEPPNAGDVRLRFPHLVAGSDTYKSAHEGAQFFGRGCFMGIRNPAAHDAGELDEQQALEFLAALSVFARWIDDAELVEG